MWFPATLENNWLKLISCICTYKCPDQNLNRKAKLPGTEILQHQSVLRYILGRDFSVQCHVKNSSTQKIVSIHKTPGWYQNRRKTKSVFRVITKFVDWCLSDLIRGLLMIGHRQSRRISIQPQPALWAQKKTLCWFGHSDIHIGHRGPKRSSSSFISIADRFSCSAAIWF